MKYTKLCATAIIMPMIFLGACETTEKVTTAEAPVKEAAVIGDNSKNSLDWAGNYKGVLPCADCEGIESVLQLTKDGKYTYKSRYLGKSKEIFTETGNFTWSADGNSIVADKMKFKIAENRVLWLDGDGKVITGGLADKFILNKISNAPLAETYWKLVELNGQAVKPSQNEAHIILKSDGKVIGSSGCNRMMGQYEALPLERIKFGKVAGTLMACIDGMDTERQFLDVLGRADSYVIVGDTLQLNKARMAPLAKFEAVYLY